MTKFWHKDVKMGCHSSYPIRSTGIKLALITPNHADFQTLGILCALGFVIEIRFC